MASGGDLQKTRRFVLFTSVAAFLVGVALLQFSFIDRQESRFYDICFSAVHAGHAHLRTAPQIGFVAIDDKSVDPSYSKYSCEWGREGWVTRYLWNMQLLYMGEIFQPKVLAFDFLFQPISSSELPKYDAGSKVARELEAKGDEEFLNALCHYDDLRDEGKHAPYPLFAFEFPDDETFLNRDSRATTEAANPTSNALPSPVAGASKQKFWFGKLDKFRLPKGSVLPGDTTIVHHAVRLPMDEILSAPTYFLGPINASSDPDGIFRRAPLLFAYCPPGEKEVRYVPSFALEAFLLSLDISPHDLKPPGQGLPSLRAVPGGDLTITTVDDKVWSMPIDRQLRLTLVPRFVYNDLAGSSDKNGTVILSRPARFPFVDLLNLGGLKVAAGGAPTNKYDGYLTAVDPIDNIITVTPKVGSPWTLSVVPETVIKKNNAKALLADFPIGSGPDSEVTGVYYNDASGAQVAFNLTDVASQAYLGLGDRWKQQISENGGMILVVGQAFTGTGDVGNFPLEHEVPRSMLHLNVLNNILQRDHVYTLWGFFKGLICFVLAAAMAGLHGWTTGRIPGLGSVVLIVSYVTLVAGFVIAGNVELPLIAPLAVMIACFAIDSYQHYVQVRQGREEMRRLFSSVTSSRILRLLEENPAAFSVHRKTMATMLFSDVEGFTALSEKLDPEYLATLINRYLSPMTEIIIQSDGYLDKYSGDGIMAIWGVPLDDPDHAYKACEAAWRQIEVANAIEEILPNGKPYHFRVRIGVNTGMVSAGNMGSDQKKQYTVMGDEVNLSARLEPTNKDYGTQLIIGPVTYESAKDRIWARRLDKIIVKGRTEAVLIYELLGLEGQSAEPGPWLAVFEEGMEHMWARRWDEADRCFAEAIKLRGTDSPSVLQRSRVAQYRENPPPDNWQGEFTRLKKD